MERIKVKSALEIATNISVLLMALIVLGSFGWHHIVAKPKLQLQTGLQKGSILPQVSGVNYSAAQRTLVIAISSRCGYCSESIQFYKQLAEAQGVSGITRILAMLPDGEDEAKQYLQQKQLDLKFISNVNFKDLNITATPTLVLVDKSGKILDFWIGKPSKDVEDQVLKAVSEGSIQQAISTGK